MEKELGSDIEQEDTLKSSFIIWQESKFKAHPAQLTLTNKKLILYQKPNPFVGAIARIFIKKARGAIIFSAATDEIKGIQDDKHGINRLLTIQLRNNEKEYKVVMSKKLADEWKALLVKN